MIATDDHPHADATAGWLLEMVAMLPAVLLAAAVVVALAGAAVCWTPLWQRDDLRNASEAAIAWNLAEMARRIDAGEDPNTAVPVRSQFLRIGRPITPMEAAAMSRRFNVFSYLVRHGGRLDATNRGTLYCLAIDHKATEVAEYIRKDSPEGTTFTCRK